MESPQPPKRVVRACDYCRKKRLKCTGQRPCLNCQLYGANCSSSDHPRGPDGANGATSTGYAEQPISPVPQPQTALPIEPTQIPSPWIPASESEMAHPIELAPDFDQYAHDLGLVLAPFWPSSSGLPTSWDDLDGDGGIPSMPYQHLPTPRLSDEEHSTSVFHSLDLPTTQMGAFDQQSQLEPLLSRSAHELFLRKGPSDSKFIGMGSVGSTIFECLRHSMSAHGGSMESTILDHLVRGIQHVDELATSVPSQTPPLPERDFAEQGVRAYYDFIHLLYPIMEIEFLHEWRQIYDAGNTLSPAVYSRFCLVVAVGNLVSPFGSDNDTRETALRLQEQTWTLIDQVMAVPFLESTQVMLLYMVFLLYCGKTGIAWTTCGMAVRIAQSLGLHQQTPSQLGLNPERINLRSRLWTVAYTLDAFLSLSEGRPPAITGSPNLGSPGSISDQEFPSVTTELPAMYIHDWDVGLATIANEVYPLLKHSQSLGTALTRIAEIDARLLVWKDSIPMEFRPDQQILANDPIYSIVAILHLKYHNLMRTIHWVSLTLTGDKASSKLSQFGARVRSSESICLASARSVIDVLNGASDRKISGHFGGFIVAYCMAALSIFYRQILKEPARRGARANLEQMRNGTLHIVNLSDGVRSDNHFRALFKNMLGVAEEAVRNASAA
ncbi:hypothetical protein V500_02593 [Pseudogymnoascus sp. VKM F-4518 (FW-2643)]|nr:hypothetical protein V500_02593 [Pseudogymnoascus sp. VKM F-4518 (FW-2643)]